MAIVEKFNKVIDAMNEKSESETPIKHGITVVDCLNNIMNPEERYDSIEDAAYALLMSVYNSDEASSDEES
jgi:uncharacterized protein Yka (UPF0111/DUF47 family)